MDPSLRWATLIPARPDRKSVLAESHPFRGIRQAWRRAHRRAGRGSAPLTLYRPIPDPAPAQRVGPNVRQYLDRLETGHLVFALVILEVDIVDVERRDVARWRKILDGRIPAQFVLFRVCQSE